jgi:hypothetical protein
MHYFWPSVTTKASARHPDLASHSPVIAPRFVADGSIEVICMNCVDAIYHVRTEAQAAPFPVTHNCKKRRTGTSAQITPGHGLEQMESPKVVGTVVTLVSKSSRMPLIFVRPQEYKCDAAYSPRTDGR